MSPARRLELLIFLATWFGFAFFNQGGGWNQNSRFAEIRAMAEQGRFAIDDFLVYRKADESGKLRRLPVERAEYTDGGKRHRLCWVDGTWTFFPVGDAPLREGVEKSPMVPEVPGQGCASGDVAFVERTGHFHPNKPPGTSFMGLPAYYLIHRIERALGIDPDHWWTLNMNLWLTTIFSVGLMSAVGCVLFLRLAIKFAGGKTTPALLATIAFAFGTTFFPFATILFDHALTAALLIAAFYCLSWDRCGEHGTCALRRTSPDVRHALAGLSAGLAVVTNYVAVGAVFALGLYALLAGGVRWRRAIAFAVGGVPMAALLLWYHQVNFGSPIALANDFQNPIFKTESGSLGMFGQPNPYVVGLLAVSPYRGVLWLCPVLIAGIYGWVVWLRDKTWAAEARLGIAIFGFFFLVNASFNGYHAGYSAGPRYLVPGIPFLALATVVAFVHWRKTALVLLGVSVVQQFLLTATDGQCPLAVGHHARIDDAHRKDDFFCNLVTEYAAPLFFTGKVGPILRWMRDIKLEEAADRLENEEPDEAVRAQKLAEERARLDAAIERGDREPFLLAAIRGPVSVNPVGVYDGMLGWGMFPLDSGQSDWASFNAGEFLAPRSRWSVLPWLLVVGGGMALALRMARRSDAQL
ncbi:MAG: hypothetical protein ABMA13_22265 [Chthoniobacteraceae bacterium]